MSYGDNWIAINAKKKVLHEKYLRSIEEDLNKAGHAAFAHRIIMPTVRHFLEMGMHPTHALHRAIIAHHPEVADSPSLVSKIIKSHESGQDHGEFLAGLNMKSLRTDSENVKSDPFNIGSRVDRQPADTLIPNITYTSNKPDVSGPDTDRFGVGGYHPALSPGRTIRTSTGIFDRKEGEEPHPLTLPLKLKQ